MPYVRDVRALHEAMVRGEDEAVLPLIKSVRPGSFSPKERLEVYTSAYVQRLTEAIRMDYPALLHYMGINRFSKAVDVFVRTTPSVYWDLNLYSPGFSDFITATEEDRAAHALAQLESSIVEVFWAEDTSPVSPHTLASLTEDTFGRQCFRFRKASKLLCLNFGAHDYLSLFRQGHPSEFLLKKKEYLFILRHDNEVKRLVLDKMEYDVLQSLGQGQNFSNALNSVGKREELLPHLSTYLQRWLEFGFFEAVYENA